MVQVSTDSNGSLVYPHRPWHSRVPFVSSKSSPPRASLDDADVLPENTASWLSYCTFQWMTPLLATGYARPIVAEDLYDLGHERAAEMFAERITQSFEKRELVAKAFNHRLDMDEVAPPLFKSFWWAITGQKKVKLAQWATNARKEPSLAMACNDAVFFWFWTGGFFRLLADVGTILSPLILKAIIDFATTSQNDVSDGSGIPSIGPGIGLCVGLFAILIVIFLCNAQAYYRGYTTGVILRGALIHALFIRATKLTTRSRSAGGYTIGKITALISADVSRIDFCMPYFHMTFTAPVQMIICLIILCVNLGYSALPGFAFFVLASPAQGKITKRLFELRKRSMIWTEKRINILQELLGGMRVIKLFAWELPFLDRVDKFRNQEMKFLRTRLMWRSINNALGFALPTLAAVISFIVYASTGHELEPAIIFSSLSLFNLLRTPLTFLPVALSSVADAYNAIQRVQALMMAEIVTKPLRIEPNLPNAIEVRRSSFTWSDTISTSAAAGSTPNAGLAAKKGMGNISEGKNDDQHTNNEKASSTTSPDKRSSPAFSLHDITLTIPRGQLCAIVGPVGAGKSSLLQALLGNMPVVDGPLKEGESEDRGEVVFGEKVGYCPQIPWIQSATIRDNITFGRPFFEEMYWRVVEAASLLPDFAMLVNGDLTEVGEKGISLSGGQRQRISIARALYFETPIILFDDSLSALDAHVGQAVFTDAIQNMLKGKTRLLVTHQLHFLPYVDWVICIEQGQVVEQGTYQDLMRKNGEGGFARFVNEFGGSGVLGQEVQTGKSDSEMEERDTQEVKNEQKAIDEAAGERAEQTKAKPQQQKLMQSEDRNIGSVDIKVYIEFLEAGGLGYTFPLFVVAVCFFQGSSVLSPYWLVFWEDEKFNISRGAYMGIYAVLGFAQAFGLFSMGAVFALFTFNASQVMHRRALRQVVHAPIAFFDTTPLGRIMNRFSKDIDTLDNVLGEALRQFLGTAVQVIGSIVLVSIILPWFLIAIVFILLLYYYIAIFYRASARELRRIDAILRSQLYSHFSESMSGLTTIRAYGETERFQKENAARINLENRAYWLTVTNQRWLSVRLDFLGSLMVFAVAILAVGTRTSISPAETGVVLSYMLVVQQAFGWAVRQSAEVENNMNAVERLLYYATEIEQEPPHKIPENKPPPEWPFAGAIEMKDVVATYRPGLPPVLKGISVKVNGGEHVGIVGRTGAGKSTITMALYRTMELLSGHIKIDGVDISHIGLRDLRRALTIIPQDAILFSGDLRSNLDPFGQYDDPRLWDALGRSYLVEPTKSGTSLGKSTGIEEEDNTITDCGLTLDSRIEEGGANLSVGQRSLVSLARALVKDSKIIIMDEATASVDFETDRNIQNTVLSEFSQCTLLCIAHRLRTIIGYDRICVMEEGLVKEFDKPEVLWKDERGIFRGMCDRSNISIGDIRAARKQSLACSGVDDIGTMVSSSF
ncbi:ABC transporter [Lentinula edodes]|uniref:ABC transporter n=1 Tax=Lentinula lateritia TaxID=40482 RepID=A0A9W9AVY7_9AGAR|nr:ABC transporter [Lentinula edodes]